MTELEMLPTWAGRRPDIVEHLRAAQSSEPSAAPGANGDGSGVTPLDEIRAVATSVSDFDANSDVGVGVEAGADSSSVVDFDETSQTVEEAELAVVGTKVSDFDAAAKQPDIAGNGHGLAPAIREADDEVEVDEVDGAEVDVDEPVAAGNVKTEENLAFDSNGIGALVAELDATDADGLEDEVPSPVEVLLNDQTDQPLSSRAFLEDDESTIDLTDEQGLGQLDRTFDGDVVAAIDHHFGPEPDLDDGRGRSAGAGRTLLAIGILLIVALVAIGVGLLAGYFFTT